MKKSSKSEGSKKNFYASNEEMMKSLDETIDRFGDTGEKLRKEIAEGDEEIQKETEEKIREKLSLEAIREAEEEATIENDIRETKAPTKEQEQIEKEQKEKIILDIGNHLNWLEKEAGKEYIRLSRIKGVSKPELYKAHTEWEEVSSATENFFAEDIDEKNSEALKISPTEIQLLEVLKIYPTEFELKVLHLWSIVIKTEDDLEESLLSALVEKDGEKEGEYREKLRELSKLKNYIITIDKRLKKEKKQWIDVLRKTSREERKTIFSKKEESEESTTVEPITKDYAALEEIETQMSEKFKEN